MRQLFIGKDFIGLSKFRLLYEFLENLSNFFDEIEQFIRKQLPLQVRPKLYYAPEWDLEKRHDGEEGEAHPMIGQSVMTPEKWNYYNKVELYIQLF